MFPSYALAYLIWTIISQNLKYLRILNPASVTHMNECFSKLIILYPNTLSHYTALLNSYLVAHRSQACYFIPVLETRYEIIPYRRSVTVPLFNLLKPNDIYIYIYIYIYMSYRSANLQTLHFKYLFNKYTY